MRVSLLQLNSSDDIAANIAAIEPMVETAAKQGATLIALPENAFYMRPPASASSAESQDQPQHFIHEKAHPGIRAAAQWANTHNVWILVGSIAVYSLEHEKSYNRSVLLAPDGTIAATYDKIHLFDVNLPNGENYAESARFLPGDKAVVASLLPATNHPPLLLGLTICYDVRFPQLYRALAKAGAQVLCIPAAFTRPTGEAHWHTLLRARAIENTCFVIAPAQCGIHPGGRGTYGHSLIIDPWGKILAEGSADTPGIITAELDLSEIDAVRSKLPSLSHDREFNLYNK